jgi:gliding motility-associated lipoprotein GldH
MRRVFGLILITVIFSSCDENRLYEDYHDFDNRSWSVKELPRFDFAIQDTQRSYNIYCNLRNSVSYPFSDFRVTYELQDSLHTQLEKKLVMEYLFDKKTGKPFGDSGLGDIYDHQFLILKNYKFKKAGVYTVQFEQFMRTDELEGILAVGLRVEREGVD